MKINKGFASVLIILAIVFIAGVSIGSYYLGKHSNEKKEIMTDKTITENTNNPDKSKILTNTISYTDGKIIQLYSMEYKNDDLGLSFWYPSDFTKDNLNIGGEGNVIAVGFFKELAPNYTRNFSFVAASPNYKQGDEPAYMTTGGWDEKYYSKNFIVDKPIQAENTTVHIFRSKDPIGDMQCEGCYGTVLGDMMGAIVETKNNKYPAIVFQLPYDEESIALLRSIKIY